jgi:aminocarboxymuconate-semialdehyde decarboxylase
MHPVIDVHSHMLCQEWLDVLKTRGGPDMTCGPTASGATWVFRDGVPFMRPIPAMFDYQGRIAAMNKAGVRMAILSLTGPNVYWGDEAASTHASRVMNASFAQAQKEHPSRLRWMASLPFEHPTKALEELARSIDEGAVGVMVLSNIRGRQLVDPLFAPVWEEIDRRALPVFLHPTVPCNCQGMGLERYGLMTSVGFTFDSTAAVALMINDGFFDRYGHLKLIVAHGGGALPFLAPRLDRCFDAYPESREAIGIHPAQYLSRLYADTALFSEATLALTIGCFGESHVMYGTDYPHPIADQEGILSRVDSLAPGVRDQVRGANAAQLFRLEIEALG